MSRRASKLVSIVVPTRGRFAQLNKCLESVYASDYGPLEVIVIDDHSPVDMISEIARLFPSAKVLRNSKRMLLAATRNRGLREAGGEFVFFLDDDNVVDKSALTRLVEGMEDTGCAVAAPMIFYKSEPNKVWYAGSWMSPVSGIAAFPFRGGAPPKIVKPYETSFFHDAFMVRRDAFDTVGEFDPKGFPIYLSEADFGERLRRAGMRVFVVPAAKVWHDVPVLKGTRNLLRNVHITEPDRAYYVARNRTIFMKRYRGVRERFLYLSFVVMALAILHLSAILASKHTRKVAMIRYYLGGLIAGLRLR